MGLGKWNEQVIDEVLHDRNDDGIAHGIVGLVVGGGELVGARRAHEQSSLARRDLPGRPYPGVMKKQELATASSFGSAEASRKIVEAKLKYLLALAGTAVAGKHGPRIQWKLVQHQND